MYLLVPDLAYPVPFDSSPSFKTDSSHHHDSTIDVHILPNDPRALALMPGIRVTMVDDEDQEQLIILGKGWSTSQPGSVLRIPYSDATA